MQIKCNKQKKCKLKRREYYPYFEAKKTLKEIAEKFHVNVSTVSRHKKKWKYEKNVQEICHTLDVSPEVIESAYVEVITPASEEKHTKEDNPYENMKIAALIDIALRKKVMARIKLFDIITSSKFSVSDGAELALLIKSVTD